MKSLASGKTIVEQCAIAGAFNPDVLSDAAMAKSAAGYIAKRLDALEGETERGWQGTFVEGEGFHFERTVRGVKEVATIDHALLNSADARRLDEYAVSLQGAYAKPGSLRRKGEEIPTPVYGPVSLFEAIVASGRKGLTLQRYKGLGEMNPEQLWETTMDPQKRVLLRVQVEDAIAADEIFSTLMGDEVEPRRQFIERNALGAVNLDV